MATTAGEARTQPQPQTASLDDALARQFGMPTTRVQAKVRDHLTDDVQAFIRRSPFLVLATAGAGGRCDASPRGGRPGFVAILDERHLLLPDVAGNRLFDSYRNVQQNPHVGMLFLIPGSERTVRVNGRARIVDDVEVRRHIAGLSVHYTDDNTILLQGLVIEVEEAYGHCPRSLKFADLWNTQTIGSNRQQP
jgi:PPOX class probable FMN-dependent enzyme